MIRLYGTSIGNGSIARVTSGMKYALQDLGALSGFVPCDAYDEDEAYGGPDARVAVLTGGNFIDLATTNGWHKQHYVLVPPNSTWLPVEGLRYLAKKGAVILSPSKWGAEMIRDVAQREGLDVKVSVWRHGVSADMKPSESAYRDRLAEYQRGGFRCLHLASEFSQRKGTRELVTAWLRAVDAKQLGPQPQLHLAVDGPRGTFDTLLETSGASAHAKASISWHLRFDVHSYQAGALYQSVHAVVQPSRGEGFGMVPLEARACGVPVVQTVCTGHAEHADFTRPGVEVVSTGPYAPIDDGPDGQAPSLDEESVRDALVRMYRDWDVHARAVLDDAPRVHREWSWTKVTRAWLAQEGLL